MTKKSRHEQVRAVSIEAENFGAPMNVRGRLRTVRGERDLKKIERGSIVHLRLQGDLVAYVTRAFDRGVRGFIANCGRTNHGAIAAKELHLPFYACDDRMFEEGAVYTLADNRITKGIIASGVRKESTPVRHRRTKTEVRINLGFPRHCLQQEPRLATYADGVGFARLEFVILSIIGNLHPVTYLMKYGAKKFVFALYNELKTAARSFKGKSVWIRTDDFSPQQLKGLEGGEKYEVTTGNELVSFRGIARSINPQWLDLGHFEPSLKGVSWMGLQLQALARLARTFSKTRLGIFVPMVHDISEYRQWLDLAKSQLPQVDYGVMVEVPSIAGEGIKPFLDEKLIQFMIIGSNDLTALTLGLDRNDERLQHLFSEEHPSVLRAMKETIRYCRARGVTTAIGGAAASRPSLIRKLHAAGIDVLSVNPDLETVSSVRQILSSLEKDYA